ncbi:MAG: NUDIX domain-containing protein [Bacteroidia bacterium]
MSVKSQKPTEFKVRVYALIQNDNQFLLSKEQFQGFEFIKFLGGGLELGETPIECLKRELFEELGIVVEKLKLAHVSEVYVQNRFALYQQVIGIYYNVKLSETQLEKINHELKLSKMQDQLEMIERFWVDKSELYNALTFEMDIDAVNNIE